MKNEQKEKIEAVLTLKQKIKSLEGDLERLKEEELEADYHRRAQLSLDLIQLILEEESFTEGGVSQLIRGAQGNVNLQRLILDAEEKRKTEKSVKDILSTLKSPETK